MTIGWLSTAVENTCDLRAGMVVFLSMILVKTPPAVSTPRDSGVTSSSRTSFTSPLSTPPWMAAPMATTSSGLTPLCGSLAKKRLHHLLHLGHPGHAADQDHPVDVLGGDPSVLERDPAGLDGLLHQVVDQLLQLGAGHGLGQVLGPAGVGGDERQVHVRLGGGGELVLGALGGLLQALQRHPIAAQVDVRRLLEFLVQVIDDALVEVLAAEEGVAVGRLHLEDAGVQLQDRDVERPAAQIVDGDLLAPVAHRGAGLAGAPPWPCRGRTPAPPRWAR